MAVKTKEAPTTWSPPLSRIDQHDPEWASFCLSRLHGALYAPPLYPPELSASFLWKRTLYSFYLDCRDAGVGPLGVRILDQFGVSQNLRTE